MSCSCLQSNHDFSTTQPAAGTVTTASCRPQTLHAGNKHMYREPDIFTHTDLRHLRMDTNGVLAVCLSYLWKKIKTASYGLKIKTKIWITIYSYVPTPALTFGYSDM
jgi:hypothetical protein